MTELFAFFQWDFTPELFPGLFGGTPIHPRWYGLLFALGFIAGYQIMQWMFRSEKRNLKDLELLTVSIIIGTVVGARLGHCLFYDPMFYLSHPIKFLTIWEGGLASHGAAFGILGALWYFSRKRPKFDYMWILDRVVVVVALAGFFIRCGNFLNSEILGTPSDLPWSVLFVRATDMPLVPRHPVQIYEALCYAGIFTLLLLRYKKYKADLPPATNFSLFLILVFGIRFLIEFIKEEQAAFIYNFPFTMGQLLSVPFVVLGIYLLIRYGKKK